MHRIAVAELVDSKSDVCNGHTFRFIDLEANEQTEIGIAGEFDEIALPVIGHNRTKFEAPHNRIANLNQA